MNEDRNLYSIFTKSDYNSLMFIIFDWLASHMFKDHTDFNERINNAGAFFASSYLYIKEESGFQREQLLSKLGQGGSKKAILLEGGRALLVPNNDTNEYIEENWQRMVEEEVRIGAVMKSLGLLTSEPQRVTLYLSPDREESMPAYLCDSFEHIKKTKNLLVLDFKSKRWSKDSLFANPMDRYREEKWDEVVSELLMDISKIYSNNINVTNDAMNIAIQPGKARYFGFDFSLRWSTYEPRKIDIADTVKTLVGRLINYEFAIHGGYHKEMDPFFDRLEEKYISWIKTGLRGR